VFKKPIIARLTLSALVFTVTTIISIWAWSQYNQNIKSEQIEQVQVLVEHTRSRIWTLVNSDIDHLKNFTNRLEFSEGGFFKYWKKDAGQLVKLDSSILFLEWIDSNMIIQDIVPLDPNREVLNLDLNTVNYPVHGWMRAAATGDLNITPWVSLLQGGEAFLVDSPVWIDSLFLGSITAGFDFTYEIDNFFDDNRDYHIHLSDHTEQQFYCSEPDRCDKIKVDEDFLFDGLINVNRSREIWWRMQFYPTASFFDESSKITSVLSLALSIFLGLTLSIALFFILKTNRQEKATKAINERLEKLNDTLGKEKVKAEKSSRVKSEFLSNMSHEIRTPLNIIQGLIHMVAENRDPEKQKEYLNLLNNSSSNLLGLLNNILDIDRIESGQMSLENSRFQPVIKIQALCELFAQSYEEKGVELIFNTVEPRVTWISGDEVKFTQIVSNFIHNALKFTPEGSVTVYYEQENRSDDEVEVVVRVKDTGIGIPREQLSIIFERFSQVDSGYRKKYSGSGLGLSINYELIRLMNGDIVVTSEVDAGTEFVITLPFQDGNVKQEVVVPEELITDFTGKKCLLVEDNELNVLVISKMLEIVKFSWHSEPNGLLGVEAFEKGEYDLVIMDLHMPVMDGMEASSILIKKYPGIPIIMLSANVTKEAVNQAMDIGIEHYITKPVSKEKLVQTINKALKKKDESK
jgi:two-component system, sensor histidine kinase